MYISSTYKTNISTSKPIEETLNEKFEEEDEKEYDKVFNHIRLSNGPDRPNTDGFYGHKIKTLSRQGKVINRF